MDPPMQTRPRTYKTILKNSSGYNRKYKVIQTIITYETQQTIGTKFKLKII